MTEARWLASEDPVEMLDALRARPDRRKLRLFAVACCRGVRDLLSDERSRNALVVAEQYANGLVDRDRLAAARDEAREARRGFPLPTRAREARAATAVQDATRDNARSAAINAAVEACRAVHPQDTNKCDPGDLRKGAALLRCIVGNPYRPATLDPAWLTPSAVALARDIDGRRAFDRMPQLAAALQEAGYDDLTFLRRCRDPGPHDRGSWVVDAILGRGCSDGRLKE